MAPGCSTHYLLSTLSPTFYSAHQPHGLTHLHGLCPVHALADRKAADVDLKAEQVALRASAGRQTLAQLALQFELCVKRVRAVREDESRELQRLQGERLNGADFRYYPRPCTAKGCQRPWFSVYAASLYQWYRAESACGICMLRVYCPSCAAKELEEAEERLEGAKGKLETEEEWERHVEEVRRRREFEVEFWEKAQTRVMLKKGVRPRVTEARKTKTEDVELEGKGVDIVRELCVVM